MTLWFIFLTHLIILADKQSSELGPREGSVIDSVGEGWGLFHRDEFYSLQRQLGEF